jgi:aldose sugar dehydrogenase
MRHKKYVHLHPLFNNTSPVRTPHRQWLQRWGVPILVLLCVVVACGGAANSPPLAVVLPTPSPTPSAVSVASTKPTPTGNPTANPTASPTTGATPSSTPAASGPLQVAELVTGLDSPWGMAFLPDGRALVTERSGSLRVVSLTGSKSAPITGVPAVDFRGQGGLLDVALDPAFTTNRRIYLSFSQPGATPAAANNTAVARAELNADATALTNVRVIFEQLPKVVSQGHYGSRLVFDKNGYLFVTLGDRQGERAFAQDLTRGHGKVMRITTDGAAAPGNPSFSAAGAQATIWTYGHRNPQGAALHPTTGELWVNEHGAQGGDELNTSLAGNNYGWPLASYSQEYGTTNPVAPTTLAGTVQPVSYWLTRDGSAFTGGSQSSIAPSGMAFYQGDKFPEYQGNIFLGALAGTALWRVVLGGADGKTEVFRERLLAARGERIRDVRIGPDGWIYLLTDGASGKLLRISK